MKREKRHTGLLVGILCWILLNGLLGSMEYQNYKEKEEILAGILQADTKEEQLSFVTGYLKGQEILVGEDAWQELEKYGYNEGYQSRLKKEFLYREGIILFLTTAAFAALWFGTEVDAGRKKREKERELDAILETIEALRQGDYTQAEEIFKEQGQSRQYGQIQMTLNSLTEYIKLMTRQAKTEKEETKVLVTNLSHQLKTPVAALKTSFDILNSEKLTEDEYREFLERCQNQIIRLEELVGALVQISRMETGLIEISLKEEGIFDTVLQAVNRIYPKAEEKEIEIQLEDSEEAENLYIRQDKKWLSETLINVLENAVKYSPKGSCIRLRMQKLSLFLRIEIEDEGMGVPAEERSQIFKRFYRGSTEQVQAEGGQGIGLYLARNIIEQHGGTIKVAAAKPRGSIFVIQLPL